ncbi:MAG: stage II sporulation protein R [Clostridia bacterium]|nr:stage II sporulation protein R [Clostridia bacterium]
MFKILFPVNNDFIRYSEVGMTKSLIQKIVFSIALLISTIIFMLPAQGDDMGIVRLHVIANSDSKTDQNLKLLVRDAVLEASCGIPPDRIESSLSEIEDAARLTLLSYGCDMPVKAQFGKFHFPVRTYGTATLPAGEYTAVRLLIGKAAGKNWWCVMYPPLCFTDKTTAHFDMDFITKNGPTQSGRPKFEIKFKLAELFT